MIIKTQSRKINTWHSRPSTEPVAVAELIGNLGSIRNPALSEILVKCGISDKDSLLSRVNDHVAFMVSPGNKAGQYKIGLNDQLQCAYDEMDAIFHRLIAHESTNGVVPLSRFANLLNHVFTTGEYDYHLFTRCGFLDVVIRDGLPTEPISPKHIIKYIRERPDSGLSTMEYKSNNRKWAYVAVATQQEEKSAETRIKADVTRRLQAEDNFIKRLKGVLRGKGWVNYLTLEVLMDVPAETRARRMVARASQHDSSLLMQKFDDGYGTVQSTRGT